MEALIRNSFPTPIAEGRLLRSFFSAKGLASGPGFEPGTSAPKAGVIPFHHPEISLRSMHAYTADTARLYLIRGRVSILKNRKRGLKDTLESSITDHKESFYVNGFNEAKKVVCC
jgi:hypothetical protein